MNEFEKLLNKNKISYAKFNLHRKDHLNMYGIYKHYISRDKSEPLRKIHLVKIKDDINAKQAKKLLTMVIINDR